MNKKTLLFANVRFSDCKLLSCMPTVVILFSYLKVSITLHATLRLREPPVALLHQNPMSKQTVSPVTVRDPFMPQISKDALNKLFGIHTVWIPARFNRHAFHSQNIHVLVLIPQHLAERVWERFASTENGGVVRRPRPVIRGHVDDCAFLCSLAHLRSQKSTHKNNGEGVGIHGSNQVFVTCLINLAFSLIEHLDIVY